MIYRLLGWGVAGGAYHKIQIVSCASEELHIIVELVHRIKKYLKILWSGWEYGSLLHFDPPLYPPLVSKNKHVNRCDEQCSDCMIRILSITLDCFIRVYWDIMQVQ